MMKVLDLFCGCGGMSWGLHQHGGFEIVAGIDVDDIALKTFKRNHPDAIVSNIDLSTISPQEWLNLYDIDNIDVVIGGPPCQGFSKNVPRSRRFLDDPRNQLVRNYLDFVDAIRPQFVIMENVAEMYRAFDGTVTEEIFELLESWGYSVTANVIDAADYGVPQHRRRAFFLAVLDDMPLGFPEPVESHTSVWEAIGDLPAIQHGESSDVYAMPPQNDYQRMMRGDNKKLHNHEARKLSDIQYARLSSIGPGQGIKDLPDDLRPKGGYSGAYGRLTKEMVAPTLTRWMFHTGSGRYGHPVDTRTITIREAARLQSFSDDFIFEGSFVQASSQIGNAVPSLVMQAIAEVTWTQVKS